MRLPLLLLTAAALPGVCSAQAVVYQAPPSSQACPIDGTASRKFAGNLQVTGGNGGGAGDSGVHLLLHPGAGANAKASARITAATVTVQALSAKDRLLPADSGGAPDVHRDFHLTGSPRDGSSLSADLWMERSATVLWVDVTEVRYADGSVWHAAAGAGCTIVPDALMPVAGAR